MKYFVIILFFLVACNKPDSQQNHVEKPADYSGKLVHTVFFKLKNEADKQALLTSLETFKKIELIKRLEIGVFEDTGNPKSELTEHQVTVQMTFDDLGAFRLYEKHPIHLASIEATKNLMAGPPIGYDYIVK